MRVGIWLVVLCWAGSALAAEAEVEHFTPQGAVKGVRQVTARFTAPMVAFGDPRLYDPFEVHCQGTDIQGSGRWVDGRNWSYDFQSDLPAGVSCAFSLKSAVRTLAGESLSGRGEFRFNTGGPAIRSSLPRGGNEQLDENPLFILGLDAPAAEDSMQRHAHCEVDGLAEKIPVRILAGSERKKVLEQKSQLLDNFYRVFFKQSEGGLADIGVLKVKHDPMKDRSIAVLACQRTLPNSTKVRLVWGAGVETGSGIATTQPQVLHFKVRPEFSARFSCDRVNAQSACIPVLPMRVNFSAPVSRDLARQVVLRAEDGRLIKPQELKEKAPTLESVSFSGPFAENAKFTVELPEGLKDDAGRRLANAAAFPLQVATDGYPPLAKFAARFGIVEWKGGAALPVTLRNVEAMLAARQLRAGDEAMEEAEKTPSPAKGKASIPARMKRIVEEDAQIIAWMQRLNRMEHDRYEQRGSESVRIPVGSESLFSERDKAENFMVPRPEGDKAFEVVGIPLKKPGFYVVELMSPRLGAALLGKSAPYHVQSAALVTNLAAHFKHGRESSLVWVTSLDDARPVAEARVAVRDCRGELLWEGRTGKDGIARIRKEFDPGLEQRWCDHWGSALLVTARKDGDLTFVRSDWSQGIEPYNFKLTQASWGGPFTGHAVLDRSLFRAGETARMKHFFRKRTMGGFALADEKERPDKLVISHQGTGQQWEFPLKWNATGTAESQWQIPRDAKLGTYALRYQLGNRSHEAGSFRVEQFRLPVMKALIQAPREALVNPKEATLDVMVSYLSGGGASGLPVKLRTQIEPRGVSFKDFEGYSFRAGKVKEGLHRSAGYYEDWLVDDSGEGPAYDGTSATAKPAQTRPHVLDGVGAARITVPGLPHLATPADLLAELEYRDPNGEIQTVSRRIPLWPAQVQLGIRTEGWAAARDRLKFRVLALDLAGKPLADREVKVALFRTQTYSHRKRLIGGFYAYEHVSDTRRMKENCEGRTDGKGLLFCDLKVTGSGEITLQAKADDGAGNSATSLSSVWMVGDREWGYEVADTDRMDLLPEEKRYEAGDTARFQVRMPFKSATALVSVEREGVMETFVRKISGKEPVIELPIRKNYAPNVFISVLALRGRVEGVKPTALVDLGKPAFKLGMAEIRVGWKPHELKVAVSSDAEVYKVRDKARVKVKVERADGGRLPKGSEVVLAAVDEALLELSNNDSWKLLERMMGLRGIEVRTATAQMQVVGKRHFGRKALPPGGGGGHSVARELFDTLLLWNGRVALDANGEASVDVPLNDSLSAFRIVAVAHGGMGLFGSGARSIRTTQDVMLHSGLPPLVREGDQFQALYTVRNAGDKPLAVDLEAKLESKPAVKEAPTQQSVALAPGEAKEIAWPVTVPAGSEKLAWEVTVTVDGKLADRLKLKQNVIPVHAVRTWQATLLQLDQPLSMSVEMPAHAVPGRGGVTVGLRARLGDDLAGVRSFMSAYRYICLEQNASKAIALRDKGLWEGVMATLPNYLDRDGLARYFPSDFLQGSDVLTSYLLAVAEEAGWEIPDGARERMLAGLEGFVAGRIVRGSALPTADLTLRKLAAIEALARQGRARLAMLNSISIDPNLWPTSALIDWIGILKRVNGMPRQDERLAEVLGILRARINLQGATMSFSTERSDALWWLMAGGDVNAVRGLLATLDQDGWRADVPRLVRGAMGRQVRGHWNTTVANAWGVLAMEKFSEKFESVPVAGITQSSLEGREKKLDWSKAQKGGELAFSWSQGWPQGKPILAVKHEGAGRPWATIQSLAAVPLKRPFGTGYQVRRSVMPVERKIDAQWSRGDVARVTLELEAQSDMAWVVVDDPIPAGAAILGSGLGRDSPLLTRGEKRQGWIWPAYEERRFDGFRAYYEFVPKGKWTVEYTLRLNNAGRFDLPPTRVEALYAPEMFAELPNAPVVVK